MSIQVDRVARTISLTVGDLCDEIVSGGSLNLLPLGEARRGLGRELHEEYQLQALSRIPGYRRERPIRFQTELRGYTVLVQGRIDGLYRQGDTWIIEEVKSVGEIDPIEGHRHVPPGFLIQLQIYLYIWSQTTDGGSVAGRLVLIELDRSHKLSVEVEANPDETRRLIETVLTRLIELDEARRVEQEQKQDWAAKLLFPFPAMRRYQDQIIEAIEAALERQHQLLISAPTGIGKTVAALHATMRFALQNGFSVFFLTSKNTQQKIVADTLRLWLQPAEEEGSIPSSSEPFLSLILQSKEKSCANDVLFCHEARCRFARNFYEKLRASCVLEELAQFAVVTPELVSQYAQRHELCPFELALELIPLADLIVCDYNYVYDPRVCLRGIFESDYSRYIIVVDEAHNLYSRARDYFSPSLERQQILRLIGALNDQYGLESGSEIPLFVDPKVSDSSLDTLPASFCERLHSFLLELDGYFERVSEEFLEGQDSGHSVISLDRSFFVAIRTELDELMRNYVVLRRNRLTLPGSETELLDFFYAVSDFCRILALKGDEFVHLLDQNDSGARLRILCLDPSPQLRSRNAGAHVVIGMSATLSPLPFYRDVLGFARNARLLSLPSPFPPENRKILVIPTVSTAYKERARHHLQIARILREVIQLRPGNYFAFFPSFEYLEEIASRLTVPDYQVLIQERWMPDHARKDLLEKLAEPGGRHLVLAVQGGVFAEGVDYPGEMAIGAFIIGPGLPRVSFEQELMRAYYDEQYSQGFEYAYLYPGMNRVVQSAGRVIRSETDRGIILLLDKRFTHEHYARHLPEHWFDSTPAELISRDYLQELAEFWQRWDPPTEIDNPLSFPVA